jgi:SAM-dependent methyltransferase
MLDSRNTKPVPEHPPEDLFARLERERLDADRLYNDALTEVDRSIRAAPLLPRAPRPFDDARVADLNAAWDILRQGSPVVDRSLKGRLRGFIWRLIGPPLEMQQRFNAALVDHVNRNSAAAHEAPRAIAVLLEVFGREFSELARFQSLLVQYLQTITVYIDSKDRSLGGRELGQRLAMTEQRMLALKRELDGMGSPRPSLSGAVAASSAEPFDGAVDSLTYLGFEDQFRGSQAAVRGRVEDYVQLFTGASDIVDVGCGRGELLSLLRARGAKARGVDTSPAMVDLCRTAGLDVEQGDALGYLQRQPDGSIGGLAAIQVVEHFAPAYLTRFLETAYHKMRSGAPLVLETINPACWMAFFETYIRDLTHQRPLHPDTLRYLVQANGFTHVDVQFRQPVRAEDRLDRVPEPATSAASPEGLAQVAAALNAQADKLNARLFSSMDYVVIARR